ncbi:WD repeat-containing protein 44-like isoform X2 [Mya arenaria]|uniref:WD repeat-containing protein 44-like isoform X2 n=1 Tax=Mya arenaria TaxID=6604 RepID=UPI0022E9491C|nr:WD repeat-containing protein 44-like isoform X2 [Mya arenaria]
MSSDSELEEFFDAQDVTPKRSTLPRGTTDSLEQLDMEEKALIELKMKQELRRRQEDLELQKRLEALKMKKQEKAVHRNLEQERKDMSERRRRRHEELRRRMSERGDNSDSNSLTEESEEGFETDEEDELPKGSSADSLAVNIRERSRSRSRSQSPLVSGPSSSDHSNKYGEISENMSSSYPEKEKLSKQLQDLMLERGRSSTIDHNHIDPEDIVENVLQESNLLQDDSDNEPDIVRSTKTRTPPSTLQGAMAPPAVGIQSEVKVTDSVEFRDPVAPPRRKKQLKLSTELANSQRSSLASEDDYPMSDRTSSLPTVSLTTPRGTPVLGKSLMDPQSPGLPPEHLYNMEERLRGEEGMKLELRTLMRGKRHIRTDDADISAINSDHESPRHSMDLSYRNKTSSLDKATKRSSFDERIGKKTSLDRGSKLSSLERGGKLASLERSSKSSTLEEDSGDGRLSGKQSSKGSSLDSDTKKNKRDSLDRRSKSSSLEKAERRRSRNVSGQEGLPRKGSVHRHKRPLSDEEILSNVMVKNLDTGELVPLKDAELELPKCVDPLVLHIMKRTNEYSIDVDGSDKEADTRSEGGRSTTSEGGLIKKGAKLKRLFGKKVGKTVNKVKSVADHVMHGEENTPVMEGEISDDGRKYKFKANHNKKGPYNFGHLGFVQDLSGDHNGAVWCMKFSPCGRLLATGGQDSVLRIWVLETAFNYFDDMRQKYIEMKVSPAPSQESLSSIPSVSSDISSLDVGAIAGSEEEGKGPFKSKPFCRYRGHSADILDVSWSKNYFILSSSMDKTVRLWHISRRECLCTFQHMDFVTAIVFHPRDDRYFLSGSLDGKLRLWNIPDKKVTLWNEVENGCLITTANFCHNGKFAVVGTYDGKCIFYSTEHLKYYTQIHVRSTRGKNSRGKKITGIEPLPGEDKVLVTSNDSRVRLYDLRDLTLTCKYKGPTNTSSQIRATFSQRGKYIVCGSEDHFVYMWRTQHEFYKFSSARRDRNDYYEAFKAHNAVVTACILAPNPQHLLPSDDTNSSRKCKELSPLSNSSPVSSLGSPAVSVETNAEFVISADLAGNIKVIRAK